MPPFAPRVTPIPESEATDKVEQAYSRVKEGLGLEAVPAPFLVYGRVPAFLQDFQMNFRKFVWSDGKLDSKTKALVGLVVASQQRCEPWASLLTDRCRQLGISDETMTDALAIGATCVMYNVFFKFRDLAGSDLFSGMSVGLRAHTFGNTSLDEKTVELINIAVSDLNGCKPCTSGHVEKVRQLGVTDEAILETIQCAATMAAGISFLNAAGY